jgi:hypothetical protein
MKSHLHLAPASGDVDTVIYDFGSYEEGVAAIRLLVQNGFVGADFWLTARQRRGGAGAALTRLVARWARKSSIDWPTRHTGSQLLSMHGRRSAAAKAHGLLVENTNEVIQECLRFR